MFNDFQKQKDLKFDIIKLRQALKQVLSKKGFDDAEGISHFGAISLNQIPGDPESTKGKNVRGVFWTKPDSSGKEVLRDKQINEEAYTEFVKDFEKAEIVFFISKALASYIIGKLNFDSALTPSIPVEVMYCSPTLIPKISFFICSILICVSSTAVLAL